MEEFDDILDQGFTALAGHNLDKDKIELLASRLADDIMNAYSNEFRQMIKQGLIDRFNAALDVERDTFCWVWQDRVGWPPQ